MSAPPDRGGARATAIRQREGRVFALTLASGFLLIALLALWRSADTVATAASSLTAISVIAAVLAPGRLGPVMRGWMKLGEAIGYVTTPILMAIVYYAVVTPTGVVRRIAAVTRRPAPKDSEWHERPPLPPRERMERQF